MKFYKVTKTTDILLKNEIFTDNECVRYGLDTSTMEHIDIPKMLTTRKAGKRFALSQVTITADGNVISAQ